MACAVRIDEPQRDEARGEVAVHPRRSLRFKHEDEGASPKMAKRLEGLLQGTG